MSEKPNGKLAMINEFVFVINKITFLFKRKEVFIMGVYTGIRFKGYVKSNFRDDFEKIALNGEWENSNIFPLKPTLNVKYPNILID